MSQIETAPGSRVAEDRPEIAAPAKAPDLRPILPMSTPVALVVAALITALIVAVPAFAWLALGWLLAWGGVGVR